ncbi:MAG: hypothetical protein E7168_00845 [Firmicutes bacterium]|nr:hypothetical protein [Bacillota bacterium]
MNKETNINKELLKQIKWIEEHPTEDINVNQVVELLLKTAKEKTINEETVKSIKQLLNLSIKNLTTMDLDLNANNSLCSFLKELSISAINQIPSVDEKNEEYFKKLAAVSLYTRQQDRIRRKSKKEVLLCDNENELSEIRSLREKYKQNYQVTKIEKITDALFLEIVTANNNKQILNFELPVDTTVLDSVELDSTPDTSILSMIELEENNEKEELDKIWEELKEYLIFTEEEKEFIRINRIKN